MSDQAGEKTEKPTGKRLEEALNKGQVARSPEVQTVFVLGGALLALGMTGGEMWRGMGEMQNVVASGTGRSSQPP